ncbi:hypothetical protein TcCL_NonESM03965 [Trypanosoma cruzi]|nr:hypothetical protein TcCL_NonESM03965 [Trypanosoma cruzi]
MSVGVCMDPLLTRAGRQPAAGALVPVHRLQHGKEKTAYSRCTYSHQQHQHAGRQPSFLSTSKNAEKCRGAVSQQCHNPAHMSAPPEKTHKLQTTPSTCHPNTIPTHRDTPNRSVRHSNATPHTITYSIHHARQQLTRGQTNVPRISVTHVLRWELNKRDGQPNPKRVPRLAASQRSAATQMNSVLMHSASHLPHKRPNNHNSNTLPNKAAVPPAVVRGRCCCLHGDRCTSVIHNDAEHLQRLLRKRKSPTKSKNAKAPSARNTM